MSPFPVLGLQCGNFYFYLNFNETFCKQIVKTDRRSGLD